LPLSTKAIRLLEILINNCGHVVDKDELIRAAWDGAFVEESAVARNIWV